MTYSMKQNSQTDTKSAGMGTHMAMKSKNDILGESSEPCKTFSTEQKIFLTTGYCKHDRNVTCKIYDTVIVQCSKCNKEMERYYE